MAEVLRDEAPGYCARASVAVPKMPPPLTPTPDHASGCEGRAPEGPNGRGDRGGMTGRECSAMAHPIPFAASPPAARALGGAPVPIGPAGRASDPVHDDAR